MKINWSAREVDVFLSLAETLSFRRTALQMHLSQSAVSGTVARLEEMLDVRLFERTTRTVQLTLAGGAFAQPAPGSRRPRVGAGGRGPGGRGAQRHCLGGCGRAAAHLHARRYQRAAVCGRGLADPPHPFCAAL